MAKYKTKRSKGLNTGTAWTEADIEVLTNMYHAGYSKWEIAVELARSSGAVEARIYIMGLHKQPKRYETDEPVSDTLTTEDEMTDVSNVTNTSILRRWWNRLLGREN